MVIDWQTVIAQLGASGIFMAGLAIVAVKYYQHTEAEISYLRGKIDALEAKLITLQKSYDSR